MKSFFQYLFFILVLLTSSCEANKSMLEKEPSDTTAAAVIKEEEVWKNKDNFQIPEGNQTIENAAPLLIQANDILSISLSSRNQEALAPFKVDRTAEEYNTSDQYLVNREGDIEFPTIGKIQVKGLEIEAVKQKIVNSLNPYFIQAPIVKIQLTNFRVNVNGEVREPGSFVIDNARLTIIEAITMAGDFTRYAQKDSVLVIREQNGIRAFGYVDFNSADIFTSTYFYLRQNDVVHVRVDSQKEKTNKGN